jgi:aminoglycoside 6-adenylyltransferase
MRRLLEWRVEIDHDWSLKPGVYGRGLERQLPADIWSDFASTYVGPDSEDNWAALFHLMALFRRVAMEVGGALGYAYPQPLDDRVGVYLDAVRKLPRGFGPGHAEDAKA